MVRTSLPTTVLPKAKVLTDALVAPPPSAVPEAELLTIRRTIGAELHRAVSGSADDQHIRVDGYRLRNTGLGRHDERPFAWSPWTARRPIALEAVRTWLASPGLSPMRAVDTALAGLRAGADGRSRSLGEWLNSLPSGARSVAQAEAVTWATQLVGALDWDRLERAVVGGDRSVSFEAAPTIRLHAAVDVRTSLPSGSGTDTTALFLAMTGRPSVTATEELGLAALTLALDPGVGIPARVIGWWPQCGRAAIAEVDLALLTRTAEAVVRVVGEVTGPDREPGHPIKLERPAPKRNSARRSRDTGEVPIAS